MALPDTLDPLSQVIALLRPRAVFSRPISGAGRWAVRYSEFGLPSFCTMLEGRCHLAVDGQGEFSLEVGDFVLLPATPGFTLSSPEGGIPQQLDPNIVASGRGELRYGRRSGHADMRSLGGYFEFESPDASLLVSLLPAVLHLRGAARLALLVQLVSEESDERRPGRDLMLSRLIEAMLIEALRSTPSNQTPAGLLRGLADQRLAQAIRQIHAFPGRPWTVEQLAKSAALSRSSFFDRFSRAVGLRPMEYVLAWRMAIAKDLLRREDLGIAEIAERVGYSSASTFSTAFSRHVGQPPSAMRRASG